jgi:hypothetical protein
MRAHRVRALTALAILAASVVACGLDLEGRFVVDGGVDTTTGLGADGAASAADDASAIDTPTPGDDAGTPRDATSVTPRTPADASLPAPADATRAEDVAVDAPFTCSGCAAQMCPKELAACGQGSQCLAYRDCEEACTGTSSAACTKSCEAMYTAGEVAFAAFTICDLNCGAGCVAGLAVGVP